jgi:hypothetical protein
MCNGWCLTHLLVCRQKHLPLILDSYNLPQICMQRSSFRVPPNPLLINFFRQSCYTVNADSYMSCRAHAVPLPCRAAKGLERVFSIWFKQCGRVWFTLAMPRPYHVLTMPFFSRPRHSMAIDRRPMGYLHAFGFFRLPHGVPRRLLSESYQSSSQRSIPTTVMSGSSTPQKKTIC